MDGRTETNECNMLKLITAALVIATAIPAAEPAPVETRTIAIADLELSSTAGRKDFDNRLTRAVIDLCGATADFDLEGRNAVRQCRHDLRAEALEVRDGRLAQRSNAGIQLASR